MLTEHLFLNFEGFHASELIRAALIQQLNELLEEAPYGATLSARLQRRQPHVFTGSMSISSPAAHFTVRATGNKLSVLTEKLAAQMRKRLDKWKAVRFTDQAAHMEHRPEVQHERSA